MTQGTAIPLRSWRSARLGFRGAAALALVAASCSRAAKVLRDRICALADRICSLAERFRDPELAQRCAEAKPRCTSAVTRVAGPCGQ
jgi:hypothetical protein